MKLLPSQRQRWRRPDVSALVLVSSARWGFLVGIRRGSAISRRGERDASPEPQHEGGATNGRHWNPRREPHISTEWERETDGVPEGVLATTRAPAGANLILSS